MNISYKTNMTDDDNDDDVVAIAVIHKTNINQYNFFFSKFISCL